MNTLPESLKGRQHGGEEARFRWAFEECLRLDPETPPSPTALNVVLGRTPARMNTLRGRDSVLRRRLLKEYGFVQDEKWGRWKKA